MRSLVLLVVATAVFAGAVFAKSALPLGASPSQQESEGFSDPLTAVTPDALAGANAKDQESDKFGDLPTVVGLDGSIGVDPNALGIGPDWEPPRVPSPQEELRATMAKIPDERKLVLAEGRVIGVVGTCSFPEVYDPDSKCIGLHDMSGLSVIGLGLDGEEIGRSDMSAASTAFLQSLVDDPETRRQILDFLKDAPVD